MVLHCDSTFITNATSETISRITIPSFSSIRYQEGPAVSVAIIVAIVLFSYKEPMKVRRSFRLRFQIAPLRITTRFASYLPYEIMEHAQYGNGVKLSWIEAASVVDGHFIVPVQGLKNSVQYNKLPPYASYNVRSGSR